MARIIIVDQDENYIIPLQMKFVNDYFNKIDLEVITDQVYFEELFSKPQNVDVLIIAEQMYNSALQKHNISNIFVMTEQCEEGGTEELNINKLFKYTSIKEIFNEIVGKSANVLADTGRDNKETQIVLVTSANGGVGKTTVAMGISACMAQNYKRVLYINASRLQCFQYLLDNDATIASSEVYIKLTSPSERIYSDIKHVIKKDLFSYLPEFKAAMMSVGLEYSIYKHIALSAKASRDFDFIVIDAESSFDEEKTQLLDIADKVIVVTEQSVYSVMATNALISNINGLSTDKYLFVCNKFDKNYYNALIAPDMIIKFNVNEYIDKYECNGIMKCQELAQNSGIRKVSFLVM